MTVQDLVETGASVMAEAESDARKIQVELAKLPKILQGVHDQLFSPSFGYLESSELAAEAKALAGLAANLEQELFGFHRRLTVRAQELGVDLPQPRSGGR